MRNVFLLGAAITAALGIAPTRSTAQGANEVPCVGYATFERKGANTELIGLALGDVPAGSKVTIACAGNGCPFSTKSFNVKGAIKTMGLTDVFLDPLLRAGMTLEVRVTKPGWIGKSFQYVIRSADDPLATTKCLSEDGSKTVACLEKPALQR